MFKVFSSPRPALLAVALAMAAAPAGAQVFQSASQPASDVQGFNLAGGGSYLEGIWLPYTRVELNVDDTPFGSVGVEARGKARASFGAEGRFLVTPVFFVTGEYRYDRFDEARRRVGDFSTEYQDVDGRPHAEIFRAGGGFRAPETPFYARGEYSALRLKSGDGADRADGFGAYGGVAQPLTRFLGVRAEAGYQSLGDRGRGFAWQAGLNLNLTRFVALTGGYRSMQLREHGDDRGSTRLEEASVGVRFQFDR